MLCKTNDRLVKRKKNRLSVRLSLKFMMIVALSSLVVTGVFLSILLLSVRHKQTEILKDNINQIYDNLYGFYSPPYGISYLIYNPLIGQVYSTNDPFLPLLADSNGEAKKYVVKDYFSDGDLKIRYMSQSFKPFLCIVTAIYLDTDSFMQLAEQIPKVILIVLLPVLLISFFLSVLISARTLKPVVEITDAAEKISSSKLDSRLPLGGYDDEIDELAKTINNLFERLQKDFERERQFSSDVSHELKTPLAVISGQANLLLRWGKDDPAQTEKSLLAIKSECKSMQTTIENLLKMSRYESGFLKPTLSPVNIYQLFVRLKDEFSDIEQTNERSLEIEIHIEADEKLEIVSDEELLHQIFTILISNSIKFAAPLKKSEIFLRAISVIQEKSTDISNTIQVHFVLEESDNGPGIAENSLPYIFDRFYRGDDSHCRNAGGSGLGLSIAKTLVEVLGGKISAKSSVQSGATFRLEF